MRAFEHNCAASNKHNCAEACAYAFWMQTNVTLALADNVRRLMAHTGWVQRELASRAGISQRAVGYLINYKDGQDRHPTTQTVAAIANAFDLETWQLMMPNFPVEMLNSKRMSKLFENYLDAPESGRVSVERVAESEVRYAVAESVLTGNDKKTGTKG